MCYDLSMAKRFIMESVFTDIHIMFNLYIYLVNNFSNNANFFLQIRLGKTGFGIFIHTCNFYYSIPI